VPRQPCATVKAQQNAKGRGSCLSNQPTTSPGALHCCKISAGCECQKVRSSSCPTNDFAYNKSATKEYPEGFLALYSGDKLAAVPNSIFTCFRIKGDSPAPRYLNYLFLGNLHGQWLRNFIQVGARAHGSLSINDSDLLALPVPLPKGKSSLAEQQKIADCLSSLDELIAAQARKVDALKTHKKGLMQQLFPREGETQPRLRFPEFRDTEDWEKSQLNRLTTKISDGIHTTPVYDENGEYAFINGNNLVNGRVLVDGKTKRVSLHEFKKHRKPLNANTILMSINGTIGNLALFRNEQVVLGKSACFINVDTDLADSFFIYYLLQTGSVQSVFNAELTGSTIKNLSLGTIKNTAVSIPRLPEQQRIASFLFLLDDLITAQTQELETLKTHKKGLIQQLFPLAEAA